MGSERSNGKRQHTQRLSGAVAFSQLVLPTLDHHASLVSGWEEPLQPRGNGALLRGVSRVDVPLMYLCCVLGMAVPAWSTVGCVLVNT